MKLFTKPRVFITKGTMPGKTILITAGMDGDEYTGIDAAYRLIDLYKDTLLKGTLIVIPIFNTDGNKQRVSWNPKDGKYPKHIFPGNKNGTPTEQLMFWVYTTYIATHMVDLWLDLHAGASNETLSPFIISSETKNKVVDSTTKKILKTLQAPLTLYEKHTASRIVTIAAQNNIPYLMLESGELGQRKESAIKQHVTWVYQVIKVFLYEKNKKEKKITVFRKAKEYYAPREGIWQPSAIQKEIKKNDIIGILLSFDRKKSLVVKAPDNGCYLWGKHDVYCKKGEFLFALAQEKEVL